MYYLEVGEEAIRVSKSPRVLFASPTEETHQGYY